MPANSFSSPVRRQTPEAGNGRWWGGLMMRCGIHIAIIAPASGLAATPASAERNLTPSLERNPITCGDRPAEPAWIHEVRAYCSRIRALKANCSGSPLFTPSSRAFCRVSTSANRITGADITLGARTNAGHCFLIVNECSLQRVVNSEPAR